VDSRLVGGNCRIGGLGWCALGLPANWRIAHKVPCTVPRRGWCSSSLWRAAWPHLTRRPSGRLRRRLTPALAVKQGSSHLSRFSKERDVKYSIAVCGFLLAATLGNLSAHAQTVPGTPADKQAIKQLIEMHASSARGDDVGGMVSTMHADADARLDDGRFLTGRAENAKFFREIVAGGPHRLAHRHPPESIRIRFLTADVAFVDVDSASVSGSGTRTPYFLVFTKVDGKWGTAVVRNGVDYK
jgi:hypothetical protein